MEEANREWASVRNIYWTWFEYVVRSPLFREMLEREKDELNGFPVPPLRDDLFNFWRGYQWMWGNRWLWEVTFESCEGRMARVWREWQDHRPFELHEEVAHAVAMELEDERFCLGRELTFKEVESLVSDVTLGVINTRAARDERIEKEFLSTRYRRFAPGRNIKHGGDPFSGDSNTILARRRALTYYHLYKIDGWSYREILSGEFLPSSLPFGPGPFDSNRDEKSIWKNYKEKRQQDMSTWGKDKNLGNKDYLKEQLRQAKKTMCAVEKGFFPDFPKKT
ncbi:MAG: hypothetical protein AB7F21_07555 [Desulfuromonadales bacterium]